MTFNGTSARGAVRNIADFSAALNKKITKDFKGYILLQLALCLAY